MKQFFLTLAAVLVGLLVFFIGLPFALLIAAAGASAPTPTPAAAVLELDLRQPLSDQDPSNPFSEFGGGSKLSVLRVVEALRRAEGDGKVKGLYIRLPEGGMAPAAADELRVAVKRLRAAGKPVFAHSQGLYAGGVVTSTYMLGASADQFWMQRGASFQATGLATEDLFFKRFFDRYGVTPDYQQRAEYKNAVNPFLYDDYTPAHREAQLAWMGSIYQSSVAAAAADRRQAPAALQANLEAGPFLAEEAQGRGLVDQLGTPKEAEKAALARAGSGAKLVELKDYAAQIRAAKSTESGPAVALIAAEGPIVTGDGDNGSPFGGSATIYSDKVAKAFYDAIDDSDVKAVVFRVSSPGGSDVASEQILQAIRATRAAGKPVVVSMGTYAASGGYWVSALADSIVASPTTLTGSIGVYGGKFALGEALARFGVDARRTGVGGQFADAFALGQPFTEPQRAQFSRWMDQIYGGFVQRVAEGRKLPTERVNEIARGRVWTGAQARQLGLVDEVGGFYTAVERARVLGKLKPDARIKVIEAKVSAWKALERAFGVSASSARALAASAWLLGDPRAEAALEAVGRERLHSQHQGAVLAPATLP